LVILDHKTKLLPHIASFPGVAHRWTEAPAKILKKPHHISALLRAGWWPALSWACGSWISSRAWASVATWGWV